MGKYILHNSPKADMVQSDLNSGVVYFSAAVLLYFLNSLLNFFFCSQGQPKLHNLKLKSLIVS